MRTTSAATYFFMVLLCSWCSNTLGCHSQCRSCDYDEDPPKCNSCEEGYVPYNNSCSSCSTIPNCISCYKDSSSTVTNLVRVCSGCEEGFYPYQKACSACSTGIENCETCRMGYHAPSCTKCYSGYDLVSGQCEGTQSTCLAPRVPIQYHSSMTMLYRGLTIFVDFAFGCTGSVSSVDFYAKQPGTFYISAWRPSADNRTWMLLGNSTVEADKAGSQTYRIPADEQMEVEFSDVLGIFYQHRRSDKIIPSRNVRKNLRTEAGDERDLPSSRYIHTRETLEDLTVGFTKSVKHMKNGGRSERTAPLNVNISTR